jgi:tetratricopeptide (TPR) repeat protein
MSSRAEIWATLWGLLSLCSIAWAQTGPSPDPEVAKLKTDFEYAKYEEILKRATDRINRGNLTEEELIEIHKYAGLSAFYLKKMPEAQRHLEALIQLDPDYSLDPFTVPPSAIEYFMKLRRERASQLQIIREERRLRAERSRREAEERERARREAEEQRRRLQELSVRTVETQSYLVNFVPFGAGQFQQHRNRVGVILAATEGVLAVTSIIAYLAYNGQIRQRSTQVDTPQFVFIEQGIPLDRKPEATVWRNLKYISGGAFWLVYGIGVVDALYHHRDQIETLSMPANGPQPPLTQFPGPPRSSIERVEGRRRAPEPPPVTPHAYLFPVPGGAGAGLSLTF